MKLTTEIKQEVFKQLRTENYKASLRLEGMSMKLPFYISLKEIYPERSHQEILNYIGEWSLLHMQRESSITFERK